MEHVSEARRKARLVLLDEAHAGDVAHWRRMMISARDALLTVWLVWAGFQAFGNPPYSGLLLAALSVAAALLLGISTGRATHARLVFYADELQRERREIHENPNHEREEVRAIYAAKGFAEPLLSQIVDTLCADDDRLLKVMMEEELGMMMHHLPHPLAVGALNFLAALIAGLALAVAAIAAPDSSSWLWVTGVVVVVLLVVSILAAWASGRALELFTASLLTAAITGGVMFYLAQWLAGFASGAAE